MPTFNAATPALPVRDAAASVGFYRDTLGFTVVHQDEGFAVLLRDAVKLILWQANDPNTPGAEPFVAGTASCRIAVTGIRELYAMYSACRVVHPNGPLNEQPWGVWDFAVLDPDHNLIAFEEPLAQ